MSRDREIIPAVARVVIDGLKGVKYPHVKYVRGDVRAIYGYAA
jgi:hypothetical protein